VCTDVPERQKLTDCTANALAFTMTCDHSPPYQFVLGVPPSHTGPFAFRGEVIIEQSTGTVARIQIGSEHMTPCNWLPGLDGYILTWNRTNAGERLGELLRHGQSYNVRVAFTESLFQKCSSRREEALHNRRMVSSQRNQSLLTSAATIPGIFQTRSEAPPTDTSLWFSSMGRAKLW
jgi:hypothetical protein